jgi:hypothetical protein
MFRVRFSRGPAEEAIYQLTASSGSAYPKLWACVRFGRSAALKGAVAVELSGC